MTQNIGNDPRHTGLGEIIVLTMTRRTMDADGVQLVDVATVVSDGRNHNSYTQAGRRQHRSMAAAIMALRLEGFELDGDMMERL